MVRRGSLYQLVSRWWIYNFAVGMVYSTATPRTFIYFANQTMTANVAV